MIPNDGSHQLVINAGHRINLVAASISIGRVV